MFDIQYEEFGGLWFSPDCPMNARTVICALYKSQTRITVDYGNPKTGKSWGETFNIHGRIGRSTGSRKIPLLIHNRRAIGGGGILTDCILSIRTSKAPHRVLYQLVESTDKTTTSVRY